MYDPTLDDMVLAEARLHEDDEARGPVEPEALVRSGQRRFWKSIGIGTLLGLAAAGVFLLLDGWAALVIGGPLAAAAFLAGLDALGSAVGIGGVTSRLTQLIFGPVVGHWERNPWKQIPND